MFPGERAGMSEIEELHRNVHKNWHDFLMVLSGMPEDFMKKEKTIGLWSIQDVMNHICAWEEIFIEAASEYLNGKIHWVFDLDWEAEGDELNAELREDRLHWTLAESYRHLCETHRYMVRAIATPGVLEEIDVLSLANEVTWKHYAHHGNRVREYRREQYPDEGMVYYVLKCQELPNPIEPAHWQDLEGSSEYIQCALQPTAVEYMANRLYRGYDGMLAALVIDMVKFQPEAVKAKGRTNLSGHLHGWFDLEAVMDVRQMLRGSDGNWMFPWI